jgi:hypothetical protein
MKDGGQLLSLDKDDLILFTKAVALASGSIVTMSGQLEELRGDSRTSIRSRRFRAMWRRL